MPSPKNNKKSNRNSSKNKAKSWTLSRVLSLGDTLLRGFRKNQMQHPTHWKSHKNTRLGSKWKINWTYLAKFNNISWESWLRNWYKNTCNSSTYTMKMWDIYMSWWMSCVSTVIMLNHTWLLSYRVELRVGECWWMTYQKKCWSVECKKCWSWYQVRRVNWNL